MYKKSSYFTVKECFNRVYFDWQTEQEVINVWNLHHYMLILEDVTLDGMATSQQRQLYNNHNSVCINLVKTIIFFEDVELLFHLELFQ